MNPRIEERLIRINVTQTCNHLLIQQPAFDRAVPAAQGISELLQGDFQSIRAKPPGDFTEIRNSAAAKRSEAARVPVTELFDAFVQRHSHMGMRQGWSPPRRDGKLAGHSKAHHKARCRSFIFRKQLKHQHFTLAMHP